MRIVIDMQGAQSASRFRGIGRYTTALIREMARERGKHELLLVLNAAYGETVGPICAEFSDLLPAHAIRIFEVAGPVGGHDPANDARRKASEAMLETFMASLDPDVILIPSLFEEFGGEAVTSVHSHQTTIPTVVVLYDLIPLIYHHIYLSNPALTRWYENKLNHLRRADLLLAISDSSRQEANNYLNFPSHAVVNISTACDPRFRPITLSDAERNHLRKTYGIERPFLMYTGGIDQRKNITGLFHAFSRLLAQLGTSQYSLVIVGWEAKADKQNLLQLQQQAGLHDTDLIFTGHVSDDDLALLYNACELFVFPSWHEGFGLPVLEAMACGKAAIAANSSSLPEVVGRKDALFDPRDNVAMAEKMADVLLNPAFRKDLERHGLEQAKKFAWKITASRAWDALETVLPKNGKEPHSVRHAKRPRLAFVSPLPPEKTGVADYGAELLPHLAHHYDVTVVVQQELVGDAWARANVPIRDVAWFRANARQFDRVLYHFGNSSAHAHMFDLITETSGVVVLHDFYLSGVLAWVMEESAQHRFSWTKSLYDSNGWRAVRDRFVANNVADVVLAYPCNLGVLQNALGVIVHANFSRKLAEKFYGPNSTPGWSVIPHLRQPVLLENKMDARRRLGLKPDDFLVCSFGILGPHKLNNRLLGAWLASPLAQSPNCRLVFVGENDGGDYGQALLGTIANSTAKDRVMITGWADIQAFRNWLSAADVAVQLRTLSRGETSGTVLDCMNAGLPTIVNAHGSMAELPTGAVWMLPDNFHDAELAEALATLKDDVGKRQTLGARAREHIRTNHDPRGCAAQYFGAIEAAYAKGLQGLQGLIEALPELTPPLAACEYPKLAETLARNFPPAPRKQQLLLDISELVHQDLRTGIQRVTRALLQEIALHPPEGVHVEPVYATPDQAGYRYARRFMSRFLEIPDQWADDATVEVWSGDVFLGLDLQPHVVPAQEATLQNWHRLGVKLYFVVYDLLPVTLPEVFPDGARGVHHRWLQTVARGDGALAISRAVAGELQDWLQANGESRGRPFALHSFYLGSDTYNSVPSRGMPPDAGKTLAKLRARPTFLMVGTIEPRKAYLQVLRAFDQLWTDGADVNLVIVGKVGWEPLPDADRRDIPETVMALRRHQERDKRLFWLEGISDEYLDQVYAHGTCLIAASYDEGFGLPLIEAARHSLPLLVRDIPVFREVTAGHAFFFSDSRDPKTIAEALQRWLVLHRQGHHPRSDGVPHQTWNESALQVFDIVLGNTAPYNTWLPDGVRRYWGNDPRLYSEIGEPRGRTMHTTGKAGRLIHGPYEQCAAGRYRLLIKGAAEKWSNGESIDIVFDRGRQKLAQTNLEDRGRGTWIAILTFSLEQSASDLAIRLWVESNAKLNVSYVEIKKLDDCTYDNEFCIMNKSYAKDLEWSIALYGSWLKQRTRNAPFFMVVPEKDLSLFKQRLQTEIENGSIKEEPTLLAEEDVLSIANMKIPDHFSGWHTQQVIKLGFSLARLAKNYLTLDSAMIFTKPFDFIQLYSQEGILCTAASPVKKSDFYEHYRNADEKGWLNGKIVNLSEALEAICQFMGNSTNSTNWYIAGCGFFNSENVKSLDAYAKEKGVSGIIGLIDMAPYEFAWYGEFISNQHPDKFFPKDPLLMFPCIGLDTMNEILDGRAVVQEKFYGILFQPPASDNIDFDRLNTLINSQIYNSQLET